MREKKGHRHGSRTRVEPGYAFLIGNGIMSRDNETSSRKRAGATIFFNRRHFYSTLRFLVRRFKKGIAYIVWGCVALLSMDEKAVHLRIFQEGVLCRRF